MSFYDFLLCPRNSVIVSIDGGLGSQITKYLVGQYLKNKIPLANLSYDITWFNTHGISIDGKNSRNFDLLNVFKNLDFKIANKRSIRYLKKKKKYFNSQPFIFNSFECSLPVYIDGYYKHYKYWENFDFSSIEFADDLVISNADIVRKISNTPNSVAVHIRRGDYVGSIHDVLDEKYYLTSIERMQELLPNPHFFIFSNGFDWVENKILPNIKGDVTLIENNDNDTGYNDFYIMSKCQHNIIANSSFSYFAALFNKNKQKFVISPKEWVKSNSGFEAIDEPHALPSWIVI